MSDHALARAVLTTHDRVMDSDELEALRRRQSGVVSRRQLTELGCAAHELARLVRRRELVRLHAGVFVDHTGEVTWLQRAWAGVLYAAPAALTHRSAMRAADGPGRRAGADGPIHVAVDRTRSLVMPTGYRLHRLADFDAKAQLHLGPPRVRIEEAVLDVAAEEQDPMDAIAVLADAVQSRRTIAPRLLTTLEKRSRIARRDFLAGVLGDIAAGTCSVLEHGYLDRVERPHGLPAAGRQVRSSALGPLYRDVLYTAYDQVVELDGRTFHDTATARDADLERDLAAAVERQSTVRLGWGQVFARPCHTAAQVGRLLQARGWSGTVTPCEACAAAWPLVG